MKSLQSFSLVVLASTTLVACSGDTGTQPADPATTVAKVSVRAPQTTLVVGTTTQLVAETSNSAGTVLTGKQINWASSRIDVATITSEGLVKGIAVGTTVISAASGGHADSVVISVSQPNQVLLTSEAGDFIGKSLNYSYTDDNAVIHVTASRASISVSIVGQQSWTANFHAPAGERIAQTAYPSAAGWPFQGDIAGVSWVGEGRGCNTIRGSFTVDSIIWSNGVGSTLKGLDLRFEQHCELATPALRGTIHWRSNDPPGLWQPPTGAVPSSGDVVYLQSVPGDFIGKGATSLYQTDIIASSNGPEFNVRVGTTIGSFQRISSVSTFKVGFYGNAERFAPDSLTGGLSWTVGSRGCNEDTGWFNVDRVFYANGVLAGIEVRFEQHCEGEGAALNGFVRWGRFT